jgi:hypothetical protein
LPDHTVIITSADLEGTRCYGAIKDEEAGFQAVPYFAKSWVEKDPAARMLLLQSAPFKCKAGDVLTVEVMQTTGANLTLTEKSWLGVEWL